MKLQISPLTERQCRQDTRPFLLFLLCGLPGCLLLLGSVPGLSFAGWAVYSVAVLSGGGLWLSRKKRGWVFPAAVTGEVLVLGLGAFLFREELAVQFRHLQQLFLSGSSPAPANITGAVLLLFMGLVVIFFLVGRDTETQWLPALFAAALLLLALLAGVPVSPLALGFLFLWFGGSWALWGTGGFPRFAAVLAAAALLFAWPLSAAFSAELSEPAYRGEEAAYRLWRVFSGTAAKPTIGGEVSRGNRYLTGTVQLEVSTSRRPSEPLYLRGFSGGDYQGGRWLPADDETLLRQVEETLNWGNWNNMVSGMYRTMYYVINQNVIREDSPEPMSITIRYDGDKYPNHFAPYYSRLTSDWLTGKDGYTCEFYEAKDVLLDWENVPDSFAMQRDWNRRVYETYAQKALAAYTGTPQEDIPGLVRLVEANPRSDLDEITAFLLEILREGAAYSQTPGWTPAGADVVENFLFEKHSGYCVHYASAATLLYRLYGVPARYAAGYLLPPEVFTPGEDGTWAASVTDEAAHAWVELFLPDYGWTPVEVTPNSQGEMTARYPGFDPPSPERPGNEIAFPLGGSEGQEPFFPALADSSSGASQAEPGRQWMLWAYLCFCAVLLLLPAADTWRMEQLRRLEVADCREMFGRLLRLFRFCGVLAGLDGTEPDFPQKAAEALSAVSAPDWDRVVGIVSAAAYGAGGPDSEGDAFVREVYRRAVRHLSRRLPWYKRPVFWLLQALL